MGVAQFGSALEWGSRGRGFKSLHPYQQKTCIIGCRFFCLYCTVSKRDLNGWESPPAECEHIKCISPFLTCFPHLPYGRALRAGTHSALAHLAASSHYITRCVGAKNHSAPATSYSRLVLGAPFLVAAAPRVPSRNKQVLV